MRTVVVRASSGDMEAGYYIGTTTLRPLCTNFQLPTPTPGWLLGSPTGSPPPGYDQISGYTTIFGRGSHSDR